MTLQIDRATVKKAVIDYASRNLLGDAKMYDIDNAKTVITKSGMVEISINLKNEKSLFVPATKEFFDNYGKEKTDEQ